MSIADTQDVALEVLGGLVNNVAPADLPQGVSPDCQDVQFSIGSVKTRPGITSLYTLAGNPTVNYMKTYENLQEVPRFLSLDSLGVLRKDVTPGGALTPIYSGMLPNCWCRSCSLFAREYFGFGNPYEGRDIPRQYDDTNFDRISQVGPGAAPSATDEDITPLTIVAAATGLVPFLSVVATATEVGNLVTFTAAAPLPTQLQAGDFAHVLGVGVAGYNGDGQQIVKVLNATQFQVINPVAGLAPSGGGVAQYSIWETATTTNHPFVKGQLVTVAGAGIAAFDGTWPVRSVDSATTFTLAGGVAQDDLAASGGGTVTSAGSIPAGKHQLSVIFVTRNGYYTKPAPPNSWLAGGNLRVVVSNIPIGPPNVIARVLTFTAANQSSFYHLGPTGLTIFSSNMYIADNTTTSMTVDFSDQVLLLGTLDDPLFNQIELPPVAGVLDYSSRLFAWGEQGNLQAFLNLTFDGSFTNLTSSTTGVGVNTPLGWILDPTSGAGGGSANVEGLPVVFGDAYAITGDGATATRGRISQAAVTDYLLNPILVGGSLSTGGISYTVQARFARNSTLNAGNVAIDLFSATLGGTYGGITVNFSQLTTNYILLSASLGTLITIYPDTVLRVYANGTPNNGGTFLVDNIEIFPTKEQFNNSNVRASTGQLATQGQESFDSENGLIQYNLNDGTSVRNMFKIRERLYIVKEHSFGVTEDDGVNEPAQWAVNDVSKKVGTPSTNGVGIGEDWVVIAHRTGLYIYWGGSPELISEEIRPLWESINWQYGYLISVTVDVRKRRIFVAAPFGSNTIPNQTLVLDYHDVGSDASSIASSPPIHLTYTGRKTAFDKSRKWCPWTISANSIAQIEQANGQTEVYFGSNDDSGNINELDDTGTIFVDPGGSVTLASDSFNRANQNPILAPWISLGLPTYIPGEIVSNQFTGVAGAGGGDSLYDGGISWPANQFSQATLRALTVFTSLAIIWVRATPGNGITDGNAYGFEINSGTGGGGFGISTQIALFVQVGSAVTILATGTIVPQAGDVFLISAVNQTITVFRNGAQILQATDSQVATGKPGLGAEVDSITESVAWDDWSGGAALATAIPSYYTTAFFVEQPQEQALQLKSHRKLFAYLTMYTQGVGTVGVTVYLDTLSNAQALNPQLLSNPATKDIEMMINQSIERMAVKLSSSGAGQFFDFQKMVINIRPEPWSIVRGGN